MTWPLLGWSALVLALAGASAPAEPDRYETVVRKGRVVELSPLLKARGLAFDAEPIAAQVVLKEDDGTVTPFLSDESSRALFMDKRLRDRPIAIQGRRYPGLPYLQVVTFQVEAEGGMHTPEYFCDVCTISVRYPQICPCCQGPMMLRMKP